MISMVEYVHQELSKKQVEIAIDFTVGNGYDTLLLSKVARKVYGFDIQETAILATQERIGKAINVELYLDTHLNFDNYVQNFDLGVFNLGYLPNFNHTVTTTLEITFPTIEKALFKLNRKGWLYITVYPGHPEGKKESEYLLEYFKQLHHKDYNVAIFRMLNKKDAPYCIEVEKR